jgi:hypothetical protein
MVSDAVCTPPCCSPLCCSPKVSAADLSDTGGIYPHHKKDTERLCLVFFVKITKQLDGDCCEGQGDRKTKRGRQTLVKRIEDKNRKGFLRTFTLKRWLVYEDAKVACRVHGVNCTLTVTDAKHTQCSKIMIRLVSICDD